MGCSSSVSGACQTLINKTGDLISIGLRNDHTITGTVVGVFDRILVLNSITVRVGTTVYAADFYWVNCSEIEWFN